MRVLHVLAFVAAAAVVTACGGQPEPEVAATPAVDSAAIRERARQDSIDAARRRAEEEARRRAEEEAAARERAMAEVREAMAAMIHFDYDAAEIRAEDEAVLDRKAAILQANPEARIRVGGHADERGSDEYNIALGSRRAEAAKRYLVNKGIEAGRIETISYGEERPMVQGSDESAWAQNRRDEFEIIAGGDNLVAPQ